MEYRYKPQPKNKNALWLLLTLTALAALSLALGMGNVLATRALWHFSFMIFAVAAIYVLLRYFCTSYLYVITEEWGEPTLVIYHVQGRRLSAHCRLALSHLLRVVEVEDAISDASTKALSDFRAERTRYSYLSTLGNARTQIIYGREGGVRFAIRMEADDAFMQVLSDSVERAVAYAAAHFAEEEQDDDGE